MIRIIFIYACLLFSNFAVGQVCDQLYSTKPGDTLSSLAVEFYGDTQKHALLMTANPAVTVSNEQLIPENTELYIPCTDGIINLMLEASTEPDFTNERVESKVIDSREVDQNLLDELLGEGITHTSTQKNQVIQSNLPTSEQAVSLIKDSDVPKSETDELPSNEIENTEATSANALTSIKNTVDDNKSSQIDTSELASDEILNEDTENSGSSLTIELEPAGYDVEQEASSQRETIRTVPEESISENTESSEPFSENELASFNNAVENEESSQIETFNAVPDKEISQDVDAIEPSSNIELASVNKDVESINTNQMNTSSVNLTTANQEQITEGVTISEIERLKNDLAATRQQAKLELEAVNSQVRELQLELHRSQSTTDLSNKSKANVIEQPGSALQQEPIGDSQKQRSENESLMLSLRLRLIETITLLKAKLSAQEGSDSQEIENMKAELETLESTFEEMDLITEEQLEIEKSRVQKLEAKLSSSARVSASNSANIETRSSNQVKEAKPKPEKKQDSCDKFPNMCKNLNLN